MKNKLTTLALASLSLLGCGGYTTFSAEKPVTIVGEAPVEQKQCAGIVLKDGMYLVNLGGRTDTYFVIDSGIHSGNNCYFNYNDLTVFDDGCDNVVEWVRHDKGYEVNSFSRDFLEQEGYTAVFDNLAKKAQGFVCEEYRAPTVAEQELLYKKKELQDIVDKL